MFDQPLRVSALAVMVLAASTSQATAQAWFPKRIALPDGFQPEGVTVRGLHVYAGSLLDGDIYEASVLTGEGRLLVDAPEGRTAIGIEADRQGRLFVAGGPFGTAYVYDLEDGEPLAEYELDASGGALVNDVVVTSDAVYFTDSFLPQVYKLPLGPGGTLPMPDEVETLALSGPAADDLVAGQFNLNGIEVAPWADSLVLVNSFLGTLYRVDPTTGESARIDLGGDTVINGDGVVLRGRTLYVVQNFDNAIAEVRLSADLKRGELVRSLTDPDFRIPTTADLIGPYLYAVNARFDVAPPPLGGGPPPDPTIDFDIVRVSVVPFGP